jgi:hypothetical protein
VLLQKLSAVLESSTRENFRNKLRKQNRLGSNKHHGKYGLDGSIHPATPQHPTGQERQTAQRSSTGSTSELSLTLRTPFIEALGGNQAASFLYTRLNDGFSRGFQTER